MQRGFSSSARRLAQPPKKTFSLKLEQDDWAKDLFATPSPTPRPPRNPPTNTRPTNTRPSPTARAQTPLPTPASSATVPNHSSPLHPLSPPKPTLTTTHLPKQPLSFNFSQTTPPPPIPLPINQSTPSQNKPLPKLALNLNTPSDKDWFGSMFGDVPPQKQQPPPPTPSFKKDLFQKPPQKPSQKLDDLLSRPTHQDTKPRQSSRKLTFDPNPAPKPIISAKPITKHKPNDPDAEDFEPDLPSTDTVYDMDDTFDRHDSKKSKHFDRSKKRDDEPRFEEKRKKQYTVRTGDEDEERPKQRKGKYDKNLKAELAKSKKEKVKKVQVRDVFIPSSISIVNLSNLLKVSFDRLQSKMEDLGFENTDSDFVLNAETASLIVQEFGLNPITQVESSVDLLPRPEPEDWSVYEPRPPVVTILGHVDHGKTTLLDTLRNSSVAQGEAGGITQHIGAFSVQLASGKQITFLDTPGHAAFTNMRQRGAQTTDIAILVVAADDGVMPQTVEAIRHILDAKVPFIVAINKCDKPSGNPAKVKDELMNHQIVVEDMGGDIPAVEVSGLTGKGLDLLEETILAVSEVLDLRGDRSGPAEGVILEAKLDRQRGNVATVLMKRGTLTPGAIICAGTSWCKVRTLQNEHSQELLSVGPSMPVEVVGWKNIPEAGDLVIEAKCETVSESLAMVKEVVEVRERRIESERMVKGIEEINLTRRSDREAREAAAEEGEGVVEKEEKKGVRKFPLIIKADVQGSLEAVLGEISSLPSHEIIADIVMSGIGPPTESEIDTAAAVNASILAFNLPIDKTIHATAHAKKVTLESHKVIYKLLDRVTELLLSALPPTEYMVVNGEAEILQVFEIKVKKKEVENIAGCRVLTGKVLWSSRVRVLRDNVEIYDGSLKTFRHVKKDITEAVKGAECGMAFEKFGGFQPGDKVQSYTIAKKPRTSL